MPVFKIVLTKTTDIYVEATSREELETALVESDDLINRYAEDAQWEADISDPLQVWSPAVMIYVVSNERLVLKGKEVQNERQQIKKAMFGQRYGSDGTPLVEKTERPFVSSDPFVMGIMNRDKNPDGPEPDRTTKDLHEGSCYDPGDPEEYPQPFVKGIPENSPKGSEEAGSCYDPDDPEEPPKLDLPEAEIEFVPKQEPDKEE